MNTAILIGSAFGAGIGLIHAAGIARRLSARSEFASPAFSPSGIRAPLYYALWTLLLWTVFGSYVFYLWLIACGAFGAHHLWRSWSPASRL